MTLSSPRCRPVGCDAYLLPASHATSHSPSPRLLTTSFTTSQGGPHNHQIGALAVALREASSPQFRHYIRAVKANAATLAAALVAKGYSICTNGTDNHLVSLASVDVQAPVVVVWRVHSSSSRLARVAGAVGPSTPATYWL